MGWKSTLFILLSVFITTTLNGQSCGESFYDSGGVNGNYSNNEFETWTICPDNVGDLVTIDFTAVNVESCCDDLAVYSGDGLDFPLNLDIEQPAFFSSLSTDGCLTVTWSSDGSVIFAGWEALINCVPAPACADPAFLVALPTSTGAFLSWLQPGNASLWDLEIGPAGFAPTSVPTIAGVSDNPYEWTGGDSGQDYDFYVRASCGADGESTWVGPVSFTTVPGCGDNFYDSGGAGQAYENNENSTYVFCPDTPGDQVTLNFTFVDIDFGAFGGDELSIYNGPNTSGLQLEAALVEPTSFTSNTADGCLTVTFVSNGFTVFAGWEAIVSCNPPPPCPNPSMLNVTNVSSSGADLGWLENGGAAAWDIEIVSSGTTPTGVATIAGVTDNPYQWTGGTSGTAYDFYVRTPCSDGENSYWTGPFSFITLPACGDSFFDTGGANGDYDNNELLSWTFCPDTPGDQVTLNFIFVDVESCCDDLVIINGSNAGNVLNGDLEAPASFTSSADNGCLTVTWDSDGSVINGGWEAIISCNPPPPCPNPSMLSAINATSSGADLAWTENGNATAWDIEIVISGTDPTGIPTVVGVTDNPYEWTGGDTGTTYDFYVNAQCGNGENSFWAGPVSFTTLPDCGDSFFDTGGPGGQYQNNELLSWTFCPDVVGEFVTLDFIMVDVEACCDDLVIRNGSGAGAILEGDLESPASFTSTADNGCLTVTWDSDGSVTRDGWEAIISCNPPPPCPNPSVLSATNLTTVGADLGWMENGDAIAWDIEVVLANTDPTGVPTVTGTMDNPYQWAGGQSGTSYDFYVRAQCGFDDENSNWIGPFEFTTLPSCGDSFYDTGGIDGNYQTSENNTYLLCPENAGDAIVLDFSVVAINTFADVLAVFNGNTTTEVINPDVEGPATFISTADNGCLTVTFTSGAFGTNAGWEATVVCDPCPPVFEEMVSIDDVNAFNAEISWQTAIIGGSYSIEYGETGFTQGEGTLLTGEGTSANIEGLEENTSYEFYLDFSCSDGTLSSSVGPFSFTTLYNNDLAITNLLSPNGDCGLGSNEAIQVAITNFGSAPQALFPLNFSVNGVLAGVNQPTDGYYTGIISNDSTEVFEFDLHYDFDLPGEYLIQLWTDLETEGDRSNDTFSIVITKYGVPFFEDFEAGITPAYMQTTPDDFVTADHNNTSFVLADNLFFGGDTLRAELPVLGPIGENDTLFFDYRYTDWSAGTVGTLLDASHSLIVIISEDCGETYETAFLLTGDNHEPNAEFDTAIVPLEGYAGSNIKIQILGIYGNNGDMWLDIDNINIPSCDNIFVDAETTNASGPGVSDGTADLTVLGAIGPFEYEWNDGSMEGDRTDLEPGQYTVSVTDRFGCSTIRFVEITTVVGTENLPEVINSLELMPNPTSGYAQVRANFTEALDAQVEVVNLLGQTVWKSNTQENVQSLNYDIDLSGVPAAMYLVRVYAADQVVSMKLLKTE